MDRNFDLAMLAMKSLAPNNEILFDDAGLPSVMVRIPKMTYAELGMGNSTDVHPAFIVNGVEVPEIYISKYQNCVYNGKAYSLPARQMNVNVTLDNAIARCTAKGAGWHLMTALEWGLIAQWCLINGTQPKGNNDYGKDHADSLYSAIPYVFGEGKRQRVLTGTGPLSWSHDGTPSGIWDLNGNVFEWQGGLRLVYGEVQVLVNNNAADGSHSQAADSAEWKAISGADGTFITPDGNGTTEGSVKMRCRTTPSSRFEYTTDPTPDGTSSTQYGSFERVTVDNTIGEAAQRLLQALCMLKTSDTSGAYNSDAFYFQTYQEERSVYRGGSYSLGSNAGLFFSGGNYARSASYGGIGFRSAFVRL